MERARLIFLMHIMMLPSCIEAFTSRMWCSPCAPLCPSLCSIQRDTPHFAYPVPSLCLLRARRLQLQWFSEPVLSARFKLLDESRTVFPVFRQRNSVGSVPMNIFRGRYSRLFLFSPTHFQQNVGHAFSARRPRCALFSCGRLTKGRSQLPFHLLLP